MVWGVSTNYKSIGRTEKLQMTNSPHNSGLCFFSCQQKLSAIMQKWKNGCKFVTIGHTEKLQMNNPPQKFGSTLLYMSMQIVCHYAKMEKWLPIGNFWSYRQTPND